MVGCIRKGLKIMFTGYLDLIAEKLNIGQLPDRLLTTYLKAFAEHEGVDVGTLPDNLLGTYLDAILKVRGVAETSDKLITTRLKAIAESYGASDFEDNLISTYLEAIIENLGGSSSGGGQTKTYADMLYEGCGVNRDEYPEIVIGLYKTDCYVYLGVLTQAGVNSTIDGIYTIIPKNSVYSNDIGEFVNNIISVGGRFETSYAKISVFETIYATFDATTYGATTWIDLNQPAQ
jgi:hypothetical protein